MPTLHWIGKDKVINHHMDVAQQKYEEVSRLRDREKTLLKR